MSKFASIGKPKPTRLGSSRSSSPVIAPLDLAGRGLKLSTRIPGLLGSWRGQVTWLERELLPGRVSLEPLLKTPYVFDVDDAIWLVSPGAERAAKSIARRSAVIMAGNSFIANFFEPVASDVRVTPTAVDSERFNPDLKRGSEEEFVVGWTGLSSNYGFLYAIESELGQFFEAAPDSQLLVVADQPPSFELIPPERVRYVRWDPQIEADVVAQMDVGLMPLSFDDWSRGKCSYKMLQYMSCGKPVVVTAVGMNAEILSMAEVGIGIQGGSEWREALQALYEDESLRRRLGAAGRVLVEARFSLDAITPRIAQVFREVSGRAA